MIRADGNALVLSGKVTAETYTALREEAESLVGAADVVLDWSAVTEVDSAAVALLLSWGRDCARRHGSIRNVHPPQSLSALVQLYGLSDIVALSEPD